MTERIEYHTAAHHEALAADLLRGEDGYPPGSAAVDRATAHARLATSLRLGELARAVKDSDRHAGQRAREAARRSR